MVALPQLTLPRLDSVASAAALRGPLGDAVLPITGTTTITSISAGGRGQLLVLEFASAGCGVTNGSNLKLLGNYVSVADSTLTLECDGTNWHEIGRSTPLTSDDFPAGLWSTQVPSSIQQTSGVSFTTTLARKFRLGKFVNYIVQVSMAGATGTVGTVITVTLPFTMNAQSGQALGTFRYDRTTGAVHNGVVTLFGAANVVGFMVGTLGFVGNSPSFAEAIGDVLWFSISGETT